MLEGGLPPGEDEKFAEIGEHISMLERRAMGFDIDPLAYMLTKTIEGSEGEEPLHTETISLGINYDWPITEYQYLGVGLSAQRAELVTAPSIMLPIGQLGGGVGGADDVERLHLALVLDRPQRIAPRDSGVDSRVLLLVQPAAGRFGMLLGSSGRRSPGRPAAGFAAVVGGCGSAFGRFQQEQAERNDDNQNQQGDQEKLHVINPTGTTRWAAALRPRLPSTKSGT